MALFIPSLGGPEVAEEKKAVVYNVLEHYKLSFLLLVPLRQLLEHVVTAYELTNDLLAISSAALHLLGEIDLANVVAGKCPDGAFAKLMGKAVLEDCERLARLESPLNSEIAVEVSLHQLFTVTFELKVLYPIEGGFVAALEKNLFELIVSFEHIIIKQTSSILSIKRSEPNKSKGIPLSLFVHLNRRVIITSLRYHLGKSRNTKSS